MQRFNSFQRRRRHLKQCRRPVNHRNDSSSTNSTTSYSIHSWATAFFILVSSSLFCSSRSSSNVQALQSSSALPPPAILQQLLQSEMDRTFTATNNNNNNDDDHDEYYNNGPILLPCCYDGLTARLIARHEKIISTNQSPQRFQATFMSGFGVSAIHGIPDTQLISYQEMIQSCTTVAETLQSVAAEQGLPHPIPCIAVRTLTAQERERVRLLLFCGHDQLTTNGLCRLFSFHARMVIRDMATP